LKRKIKQDAWDEAAEIAALYTNGDIPEGKRSITRGANHYHTVAVEPQWAKPERITARIGNHIFYRL